MAKNTQPIAKRCKALGISPAVMGYAKKNTTRNSNGNMRKKQSEYASQLKEKQKVKFIYGVLEKQFHNAYLKAESRPGKTGENLLLSLFVSADEFRHLIVREIVRIVYIQQRSAGRKAQAKNRYSQKTFICFHNLCAFNIRNQDSNRW